MLQTYWNRARAKRNFVWYKRLHWGTSSVWKSLFWSPSRYYLQPGRITHTSGAFLNNESQSSFITESACQELQLRREKNSSECYRYHKSGPQVSQINSDSQYKINKFKLDNNFWFLNFTNNYRPLAYNTNWHNLQVNYKQYKTSRSIFSTPGKIDIYLDKISF